MIENTTTPVSDVKQPTNFQLEPNKETQIMTREQRAREFREELKKAAESDMAVMQEEINKGPREQTVANEITENKSEQDLNKDNNTDTVISDDITDPIVADTKVDGDESNSLDNKMIPKKRLDKELKKRQELESKLQEEREARIRYETELSMYNEALKKLHTPEVVAEPEIDPLDSDAHKLYMRKINELEKKLEESTKNLSQQNMYNKFESDVNRQTLEFEREHKDFQDAYKYVVEREMDNAKLMGIADKDINGYVLQKLQPIAHQVYSKGGNVPEALYKIAKNYGYQSNEVKGKGSNVNLNALQKNMSKSSSIIDDVPAVSVNMRSDASAYLELERFEQGLMNKDGRGVDKQKFRDVLNRLAQES